MGKWAELAQQTYNAIEQKKINKKYYDRHRAANKDADNHTIETIFKTKGRQI